MDKIIEIEYYINKPTNDGGKSIKAIGYTLLSRIESIFSSLIVMKSGHIISNVHNRELVYSKWRDYIDEVNKFTN